jgi:hypothetical protein
MAALRAHPAQGPARCPTPQHAKTVRGERVASRAGTYWPSKPEDSLQPEPASGGQAALTLRALTRYNEGTGLTARTQRMSGGDSPPPAAPLAGRAACAPRLYTSSSGVLAALCSIILRCSAPALSLSATAHGVGDRRTDDTSRNACDPVAAACRPSIASSRWPPIGAGGAWASGASPSAWDV